MRKKMSGLVINIISHFCSKQQQALYLYINITLNCKKVTVKSDDTQHMRIFLYG